MQREHMHLNTSCFITALITTVCNKQDKSFIELNTHTHIPARALVHTHTHSRSIRERLLKLGDIHVYFEMLGHKQKYN